mgnify:CR=1 FL=1
MPIFNYTAKSQPGKTEEGSIDAQSQGHAIAKLTGMGYFPVSVEAQDFSFLAKQSVWAFKKISRKDITIFTRQLAALIGSGVNIINGLNIVCGQTQNKHFKAILSDVIAKIKDGKSLSAGMSLHPYVFSELYTSLIYSGEAAGKLEDSLGRLADFLEKDEDFRSSIKSALTYPIFVLAVGVLTVVGLLGFVIPRLVSMFEDMGQLLPLPTRILISISGALRLYWWLILFFIIAAVFFIHRLYKSKHGRLFWDSARLKIIVLGEVTLKTEISRLTRTLSLLISGGQPIVSALEIATSVIGNEAIKIELKGFKEQILAGESFSKSLSGSKLFPVFVNNIISVGEESGRLDKALSRVAEDYQKDVDNTLKALTRLVEPVIILVMGLIVGFIVLAMLLPIFQINLMVK